ncbi:hypothetical protein KSS87_011682 [Heliosperma pusillum]|nr:hypothetical protein KSS87_011682 [Heliosperma pusillum]
MAEAIMSCFALSKPCFHKSPLNLSPFNVTHYAATKLLRQCSTSKFGYGLRHYVEKIERGSNVKVNAFPDWPLMAVMVEHIPGQRDLVTYKSIWHLSDNAIKNDPFYDSEQYRKDGGDGTGYWVYEKQEDIEEQSRAELWREELIEEIEQKDGGLKELEDAIRK